MEPLAQIWTKKLSSAGEIPESAAAGRALLLAGSCSKATLEQIAWYQRQGNPSYQLDPKKVLGGGQTVADAWAFIQENSSDTGSSSCMCMNNHFALLFLFLCHMLKFYVL